MCDRSWGISPMVASYRPKIFAKRFKTGMFGAAITALKPMAGELHSAFTGSTSVNTMLTVQLAIENQRYAAELADLLQRDGSHVVVVVDHPDPGVDGIIVVDGDRQENLVQFETQPERFVVIVRKSAEFLSRVWDAGVRHVAFEEDSPRTALLAISAAELRVPQFRSPKTMPLAQVGDERRRLLPKFPVPILDSRAAAGCSCLSNIHKTRL